MSKTIKIFNVFFALCFAMITIVFFVQASFVKVGTQRDEQRYKFSEKWNITVAENRYNKKLSLPTILKGNLKNKTIILENKLDITKGINPTLMIRTSQQRVKVFFDDVLVYSYPKGEEVSSMSSLGSLYHFIRYDKVLEYKRSNVRIELSSHINNYAGILNDVRISSEFGHLSYVLRSDNLSIAICAFIMFISLISIFLYFSTYKKGNTMPILLQFGLLLFTIALCIAMQLQSIQYILTNPVFVLNISLVTLFLIPYLFYIFLKNQYKIKFDTHTKLFVACFFAIYIIVGIMKLLGITDYLSNLKLIIALFIIFFIDILSKLNFEYKKGRKELKSILVSLSLIVVAVLFDGLTYIFFTGFSRFMFTQLSFVFFSINIIYSALNDYLKKEVNIVKNELSLEQQRYKTLIENSNDIIFGWNILDKTLIWNAKYKEVFGKDPITSNFPKSITKGNFINPNDINTSLEMYDKILSGSPYEECEVRYYCINGKEIWCRVCVTTIFDQDKKPESAIGIIRNISEQKEIENSLKIERENRVTWDSIFEAVLEVDVTNNRVINYKSTKSNRGIEINNGDDYNAIILKMLNRKVHTNSSEVFSKNMNLESIINFYENGQVNVEFDYLELTEDNKYAWKQNIINVYFSESMNIVKAIIQTKDIQEQKEKQQKLIERSQRDSLTKLYNKHTTKKLVNEYLAENSNSNTCSAFLIVDIDNFKKVNDTLGHLAGDGMLFDVAQKLNAIFRKTDIIGRIGGDEFVVFIKNIENMDVPKIKAQEICEAIHKEFDYESGKFTISASVGVCIIKGTKITYEELYNNSDIALYDVKNNGKNSFSVYQWDKME
jgi:diguanylate cyclase (GGDEF)-like protein/PAS domain S-box-containing protein